MFGKLAEARKQAEALKAKLGAIRVTGADETKMIQIEVDGNKQIVGVTIDESFLRPELKPALEKAVQTAIIHAMTQADNLAQAEMRHLFGGIPGIGDFLK